MKNIKLIQVAAFCGVSPAFLCEIRKGKKHFSKKKSREISIKTGIPLDSLLFTNGEGLYRALRFAYATTGVERNQPREVTK